MNFTDLTIIITCFQSDNKLKSCLGTIDKNIKVIVVENSNRNEFKNEIEHNYKNVRCVLTKENLGYAKGNNIGLKEVKTNYALILNPDTLLDKEAILNFFKFKEKTKEFAIVGPGKQGTEISQVEYLKGYALFLNLSEFNEIGYFDENFFMYLEDIDLCKRVRKKNKKIFINPNIKIYHKGASSHDEKINYSVELSRNWHWMWSKFYYNKKHFGIVFSVIKIFPNLLSALFKSLIFYFFNKRKSEIYLKRLSGILNSFLGKKSWYRPSLD